VGATTGGLEEELLLTAIVETNCRMSGAGHFAEIRTLTDDERDVRTADVGTGDGQAR
jgi:hypothetical protein